MKIIAIRQPWAYLTVTGIKPVENRGRNTHYRGPILIHATKTIDEFDLECVEVQGIKLPKYLDVGGIVGICDLVAVVQKHQSSWFVGPFGYVLDNARQLPFVPAIGRQGIYDADQSLMNKLKL